MIRDYFILAWKETQRRKLRSLLTLLGIIIGIAAIISLISLGQGLQNAISKQFNALGTDKLIVTPKGNSLIPGLTTDAVKITEDDLETIRATSGVEKAAGMTYSSGRIEFNDHVRYYLITGMPTAEEERLLVGESNFYHLLKGRSFTLHDKYKAILGNEYTKDKFFEQEIAVGDTIIIQEKEFKVIGFWKKTGSPPDDTSIMIPLETYGELMNKPKELGMIFIQIDAGENIDAVAARVKKELRKDRHLEEGKEDFNVETPQQLAATFSTILDIVQAVLIGIAGISLFVGGIGIMNTMYTAVLQRTKEIGLLKAVGAKNDQILILFLIESGLYGLGGGLIGLILGISFAKLVELIFTLTVGPAFLSIELNYWLMGGTLFFSFLIGCISGLAPARRASTLNPVEALRYE